MGNADSKANLHGRSTQDSPNLNPRRTHSLSRRTPIISRLPGILPHAKLVCVRARHRLVLGHRCHYALSLALARKQVALQVTHSAHGGEASSSYEGELLLLYEIIKVRWRSHRRGEEK